MEIYPDFSYRLIFKVYTDDYEHKSNSIVRHFISLYKTMHTDEFFELLDTWYTTLKKNFEALQQTFPISFDEDNKSEITSLFQFSHQTKISYTPAILINGRLLSQLYAYNDLYGIARTIVAEE
jgi:bisphosphoglycerate-independent phosphoglycerate mutase (AlkP superfamily)